MKILQCVWIIVLILPPAIAGCGGASDKQKATSENQYDIKGKVTALDANKPAVTLDHEDIPGLMKGMQMEFPVLDAKLLKGIRVGDQVQGKLKKGDSGYIITELEKR